LFWWAVTPIVADLKFVCVYFSFVSFYSKTKNLLNHLFSICFQTNKRRVSLFQYGSGLICAYLVLVRVCQGGRNRWYWILGSFRYWIVGLVIRSLVGSL